MPAWSQLHLVNTTYSTYLFLPKELHKELDDQENVVEFDFLGKDSIRYQNKVPVEKRVCISFSVSSQYSLGVYDLSL